MNFKSFPLNFILFCWLVQECKSNRDSQKLQVLHLNNDTLIEDTICKTNSRKISISRSKIGCLFPKTKRMRFIKERRGIQECWIKALITQTPRQQPTEVLGLLKLPWERMFLSEIHCLLKLSANNHIKAAHLRLQEAVLTMKVLLEVLKSRSGTPPKDLEEPK